MNSKVDIKTFITPLEYKPEDGIFKKIENNPDNNIKIYPFLTKEQTEQFINMAGQKDGDDFIYHMIPIISNIDMTISLEEFKEICNMPMAPTYFLNTILTCLKYLNEIKKSKSIRDSIDEELGKLRTLYKIDEKEELEERLEVEKKKELEKLYKELSDVKGDKEKRKEILSKIDELEK